MKIMLTLLFICAFYRMGEQLDLDQQAHNCHLITIYTMCFLVRNNPMTLKANNTDPDQMAGMADLDLHCLPM
jgi:hypothetical protein